jgi:hypothetical protein
VWGRLLAQVSGCYERVPLASTAQRNSPPGSLLSHSRLRGSWSELTSRMCGGVSGELIIQTVKLCSGFSLRGANGRRAGSFLTVPYSLTWWRKAVDDLLREIKFLRFTVAKSSLPAVTLT